MWITERTSGDYHGMTLCEFRIVPSRSGSGTFSVTQKAAARQLSGHLPRLPSVGGRT
jgi:peptidase E